MKPLKRVAGGRPDGGQFAGFTRPAGTADVVPPIGEFLAGDTIALGSQLVERVRTINSRFQWLPLITVLENLDNRVSLLYQPPGEDFHPECVIVYLDHDGNVTTGGHGEEWYASDADHPMLHELKRDFGVPQPST